jgi:hypothetical protein
MKTIPISIFILCTLESFSQQASYFDPAQAYNRLLIEKGNGSYTRVNNYKVTGTCYLYGEKNKGNIFSKTEKGFDILLSYDTYSQNIYFFPTANGGVSFAKEPSSVDSFTIKKSTNANLEEDILFVYGNILGATDKSYYQVILKGEKVNLYKKYSSELGLVTTNIIQSDLRQFNILVDYYYTDSTNKAIKKIKLSARNIAKEFEGIKNLSSFINSDELTVNKEKELIRIFEELNK